MSSTNHHAGNVRPAYGSARCLFQNTLYVDLHSQSLEPLDNSTSASLSQIAKFPESSFDDVATRNMQRQKMNFTRAFVRAQLNAGDDANSHRMSCALCFIETSQRIVIGKSDCGEACSMRCLHDFGWSERSVRRRRVHVKIDLAGRPLSLPFGRHFL